MGRAELAVNYRHHCRAWVGLVTQGGVPVNFEMTNDVDGGAIEARITIQDLLIMPSQNTIFRLRLFTRESRIADINNPLYSLCYERDYPVAASGDLVQIRDTMSYVDDDALDAAAHFGTIWGTLEVQAASNNSAFMVDVFYGTV